ncbi:hypothetical protein I5T87_08815 [Stenotrophomonas maltophilia]|uniref:hypothetical protein n=1 Tax=Stenotrophomonas maltophilia TaxID=40324 RepID=UPI0015DF5633|nr:hypothetical protein [Stenotrophomonas maltophilia]MBH1376569.1 hypothetical protein [Stenotrophomonas maltophilia]MBH1439664.1 hypothetical protein [Stenotrophomonas maltophilia]
MDKTEVVGYIQAEIAADSGIAGAELTRRLRERWPEWSPLALGSKTLRSFITDNLPGIGVVGQRGLDPVYGVTSSSGAESRDENLWRIWASPGSPCSLVISPHDGQLGVVGRTEAAPEGGVKLSAPGVEAHRQIARDFLEHQFQGASSDLEPLIGSGTHWWQQWMKEVKKRGISASWGQFRFHRLLALFSAELASRGVVGAAEGAAIVQLRGSMQGETSSIHTSEPQTGSNSLSQLRQIAIGAIERMSEEQLRQLKVPLGSVLDALKHSR